jgi:asparagine synthetase B (glutamine-hydrolysing)
MPGVVGVFGHPRADDVLHAAARRLLRRPWQRLEVAYSSGEVALGFVGEHGGVASDAETGVALALDGELFEPEGACSGGEAARILLQGFLSTAPDEEWPQGAFAAAVWDPRDESLTVLTDNHGRRPVWLSTRDGATILAGELKALVAAGVQPELDLETWAQIFAYEGPLPGYSQLQGVSRLPAGATLRITPAGQELEIRWRYRLEPDADGELHEWADEFWRLLDAAVARRLSPGVGLALSGGSDSRCVGAVVRAQAPGTVALTYGAPGSDDLRLGTEVATRLGLPHEQAPLEPGYIARGAAETVWLTEGAIRAFHVHHLALRLLRRRYDARAVLINYGGDHIMRTLGGPLKTGGEGVLGDNFHRWRAKTIPDELAEEIFVPRFAAEIRGLARAALRRQLDAEEGEPLDRARQVAFAGHGRRIWPGAELFIDDLAPRDPYDDRELIDKLRRMPERLRVGADVQREFLRRLPELGALPNTKDELAPGLAGRRRQAAEFGVHLRRGLRRRVDARIGPRWWPVRSGLGDYATDLRRGGGELLGILLEPRTLARGQMREQAVRRMISDLLSGRARHTQPLGVLVTFELFQRQFIDGEGFELKRNTESAEE